jgi:uncharacterized protein
LHGAGVADTVPRLMSDSIDAPVSDDVAAHVPAAIPGFDPVPRLAAELELAPASVAAVIELLADGNTVPFIARYRKEATGGLDEVQIRTIEERRAYLTELEARRAAILASITEQGKLTPELEARIRGADAKSALEDLYAPYRPRRRTRAQAARDKGLEPLALRILAQSPDGDPAAEAAALVSAETGVATAADALAGARDIAAEAVADTAEVRAFVRRLVVDEGEVTSEVVPGKNEEPTKFELYYAFKEVVRTIPSHRFLAIRRGEAEGVLRAQIVVDAAKAVAGIERLAKVAPESPWAPALREAVADAYKRLLAPSIENDIRAELKRRSDNAAVEVFADNLRNLLLAPPLGGRSVIGVDPGLRTGCKCAVVSATGRYQDTITVFISQGDAQLAKAKEDFLAFVNRHDPAAIAVGNGTGGREAEAFVRKLLAEAGKTAIWVVSVNESGASVYSASDLAREEFPELDLTIRGAISIARRLQDPLAELVKVEPKAIGVGQYQHDVHQPMLVKKLGDVVESCVNHVGVELNTASAELLQYVAGIGKTIAKRIVARRDESGAFTSRRELLDVSGLGPKAFEQAAGFLRIRGGAHPLDASAVHPERYGVVERMATDLGVEVAALVGNPELVGKIDPLRYVDATTGGPTLRDIVEELKKPGRDPRAEFSPPRFRDDVTTVEDLKPGMVLEGVITNVTAFGAFVDVGVHQDGLIHVSRLSDRFVKDPAEVVKVGQKLQVRVLEVDLARKRIALSARSEQADRQGGGRGDGRRDDRRGDGRRDDRRGGGGGNEQRADQRGGGGGGGGGDRRGGGGGGGGRGPRRDDRGPRQPNQNQQQGQGPQGQGPQGQGPQGQGPQDQQGQGQAPQGEGGGPPRRDDRGGPRRDDRGGPRRDDRGPRNDQGGGGRRDDRGPRRDDRGGPPRRDDRRDDRGPPRREEPPPPGYGISGFVNNPFAKLMKKDEDKKS